MIDLRFSPELRRCRQRLLCALSLLAGLSAAAGEPRVVVACLDAIATTLGAGASA